MAETPEATVLAAADAGLERTIDDIRAAIRIPGVSKTGEGLREMADFLGTRLGDLGACVTVHPGQVAPIVEGELRSPTARHTLLFYSLYDVQPADPAEWTHPPFAAEIVTAADGARSLVGRGAFNSKGPLFGFIAAVRAFQEAGIDLPVNIVFLVEGEEEIGSPSLEPHIRSNLERFRACDCAFIPYLGTNSAGETPIRLGFKGLAFLEFTVEGGDWGGPARHDIHAMHAAWIASPGWELLSALATLQTRDGRMAIEGVEAPQWWTDTDLALIREAAQTVSGDTFLSELGARTFRHQGDFAEQLSRFLFDPSLNIDGIWVGSSLPGSTPATQMPHKARALVDLRFVPGMDVADTLTKLRQHLDRRGYAHVNVNILSAYPASRSQMHEPVVSALVDACRQHSRRVTVLPLHAGAAPLHLFSEVIGIPYAFGGLGHGGRPHAPDEYLNVESMRDYLRASVSFLFKLGDRLPC